jgi:hypothetical protein
VANFSAVYSVGDSLVSYLRHTYELTHVEDDLPTCKFQLVSSQAMAGNDDNTPPVEQPGVTLFLYRVTVNEHLRNASRGEGRASLPLDLHYLLTVWATDVDQEHRILAWTMKQLHMHEALSASDLTPDGGWGPGEMVHVIPAEITHEDLTRLWDTLRRPYRPSLTYVARVVQIDVPTKEAGKPVVARRFTFTDRVP